MALPVIGNGDLTAAEVAFNARFMSAYKGVTPLWSRVASLMPSNNRTQNYPIHGKLAKLRKWEGERVARNAKAYSYTLTNEKYELTLRVPLEDFEDDQLGIHAATIDDMGQQAALWPDDLVFAALLAGSTDTTYDGKAFFANDHALKSDRTIDNLFASTSLTHDNYGAVRTAMMEYAGEDGESLRVMPNLLVVPPALEKTGLEILASRSVAKVFGSNTAATSIDNIYAGSAQLLVVPQLAASAGGSDTTWYMMDVSRAVKPLIFQQRSAPLFQQLTRDSDHAFLEDEVMYGVRARGTSGYGPFWLAAKCTA